MSYEQSFLRSIFSRAYLKATELLYHQFAWAYEVVAWLVSFGKWAQWRLDVINYLVPGRVLEVGFGPGELLIEMSARGLDVIGLEPSPNMQRVAGRRMTRKGVQVKRVSGRSQSLPFPSIAFSNVVSTFPSSYILEKDSLQEIHRVLVPNGQLLIVGLGVHFKSGFKRWMTKWFFETRATDLIQKFMKDSGKFGYQSYVVTHEEETYRLPIIILERHHE